MMIMKKLLILLVLLGSNDPVEIAKINRLKSEAKKAYTNGDFQLATEKYSMLYDSMSVTEDEIALNLAHSYYALNDSSNARSSYEQLTTSSNNKLKSIAYQQLGVMAKSPQTLKQSLAYLKAALKADPTNEDARYDYEVVKKLLDEQQKQDQEKQDQNKDDQNKDQNDQNQEKEDQNKEDQQDKDQEQQEKDQQDQEKKDSEKQDGEKNEQEKQDQQQEQQKEGEEDQQDQENKEMNTREKLEEMNISEEKAKMILEAMKNNEIQYIQQQKRKATKSPESGKPDW